MELNQKIAKLNLKPSLSTPFPRNNRYWKCPKTGLVVPKFPDENIEYRERILREAEDDEILQRDLMAACAESVLFWINTFCWTFHQHEVDPATGRKIDSPHPHVPFVTWDVQDRLFDEFDRCLKVGDDILIDKCRDVGASWCCGDYIHHKWLFRKSAKMLEMSRTKEYVDQTDNHKALFQKHDYTNLWLPEWMRPPQVLAGERYRTSMHMHNVLNDSTIDGESTTPHAGSGDRRLITLLDEFAKVEHGTKMRSATKDVSFMRIINSTPAGPGTEYARWKQSGQIKVFQIPFWEHPTKGAGRFVTQAENGEWQIKSPWLLEEEKTRSPKELAQEVLCKDLEAGDGFFTLSNLSTHLALFGSEPKVRMNISLDPSIPDIEVSLHIERRNYSAARPVVNKDGNLRVWGDLTLGRLDQSLSYIIGCDISKGQGASNSVLSVKCRETGEKVAEWRSALVPPYDLARIAVALAIWVGGRQPHRLPLLKWENNGPGWDFGREVVKKYHYPYYYTTKVIGIVDDKSTDKYGWHSSHEAKTLLLRNYDRALAHGGYINHSVFALEEAKTYIYFPDGYIGPAALVEENASARKTHGDCVIADALTLEEDDAPVNVKSAALKAPENSTGWRKERALKKHAQRKSRGWRCHFDFTRN